MAQTVLDIQGHRGCRGLMPENTIPAFIKAVELGVTTLELDVVITKDIQVLVSHEPWLNFETCLDENGNAIDSTIFRPFNLYTLTYDQIKKFDCGSKGHPRFPQQQKQKAVKPLLLDVITEVRNYCSQHNLPEPNYNIEIKSDSADYGIYQPQPEEFCLLVMQVIQQNFKPSTYTVQSFDFNVLRLLKKNYSEITLAALTETEPDIEKNIAALGFTPPIFSPYYFFVTEQMVSYCKQNNIRLIPWTVNKKREMEMLIKMGVDGIITDYPNLLTNKR